jgi:GT2 family glycosyltransferase
MALAHPPDGTPPHPPPAAEAGTTRAHAPRRAAAPPAVELTVVVVNFCQWKNTARLVHQLRRAAAVRTGVVHIQVLDNGSPTHPFAGRVGRMRGVSVRHLNRNVGFAAAVNRGCRLTGGPWVLLLNPDTTVPDGFLDDALGAIARAEATPDAGAIGFRLLNRDGTPQPSAGPFPTFARTLAGVFLPRDRRKCRANPGGARRPVEWATGGCLLLRRACFDQLGGLDESFFLYYEDVDFCRRAADRGWGVWFDPGLEVTHHWPLHARRVPPPLRLVTRHALLTYARRHWSGWQARALSAAVWAEAAVRQAWAAVRGESEAARCFGHLRKLVGDVAAGRTRAAAERVRHAAAFLHPIAAEQDGRTE